LIPREQRVVVELLGPAQVSPHGSPVCGLHHENMETDQSNPIPSLKPGPAGKVGYGPPVVTDFPPLVVAELGFPSTVDHLYPYRDAKDDLGSRRFGQVLRDRRVSLYVQPLIEHLVQLAGHV